jgi:ribosomal protein S18 acetylase RimI-like enzyme
MAGIVTFRSARSDDFEALVDLKHIINLAEYESYAPTTRIPPLLDLSREAARLGIEDYFAEIRANGGAFLVGELDGQIVCCGCWYGEEALVSTRPEYRRQAGIGAIVVAPSARGLGLGRRIMCELEVLISAAGISQVRLSVVPGNGPAELLYEGLGFEPFEIMMIKTLS